MDNLRKIFNQFIELVKEDVQFNTKKKLKELDIFIGDFEKAVLDSEDEVVDFDELESLIKDRIKELEKELNPQNDIIRVAQAMERIDELKRLLGENGK